MLTLSVIATFPAVDPVSVVTLNLNSSPDSSQNIAALLESPLSTTIPASRVGVPDWFLAKTIKGSSTNKLVVLTVVVSPFTVKSPVTITSLEKVASPVLWSIISRLVPAVSSLITKPIPQSELISYTKLVLVESSKRKAAWPPTLI